MSTVDLKIAYIGGGSREWARKLMMDLALCPELTGVVALYDIDEQAARLNEQLGNWLQGQPGVVSKWVYRVASNLHEALHTADFVIISIQPGTLELMAEDIAIAEGYGLFFPVGDTIGAPGLMRGLRSTFIFTGFAEAISIHCPTAWVINYTNPLSICTGALTRVAPELKVFGCCHEVFSTQSMLARIAGSFLGIEAPSRRDIQINVLGINHFTWINRAFWQGYDLLDLLRQYITRPGILREYTRAEVEAWKDWFHCEDQVKLTLFQHFGILPAAGDRHLVEFMPGFIRSPETLFKWGIIRTPVGWRIERWKTSPKKTRDLIDGRMPLELKASGEEGTSIIKALAGLGDLVTNVNMPNNGQVTNLPSNSVVETNTLFTQECAQPLAAGSLPSSIAALISRHITNQELIIEAALTHDKELAFQAVFNDPASHLPVDEVWEMFNRMLQAGCDYLPDWH